MKRMIALLLLAALLLAGCQAPAAPADEPIQDAVAFPPVGLVSGGDTAPAPEGRYPQYAAQPLPGGLEIATAQCAAHGQLYTGGLAGQAPGLYVQDEAGTETALELPEDTEYLYATAPWGDGCVVLCGSMPAGYVDELGNLVRLTGEPANRHELAFYTADGALDHVTPLRETYDTALGSFRDMAVVDGGFVLLHPSYLVLVDESGVQLSTLALEDGELARFLTIAAGKDGLYALKQDYDESVSTTLLTLNPATLAVEAEELPDPAPCGLGTAADGTLLVNLPGDDGGV